MSPSKFHQIQHYYRIKIICLRNCNTWFRSWPSILLADITTLPYLLYQYLCLIIQIAGTSISIFHLCHLLIIWLFMKLFHTLYFINILFFYNLVKTVLIPFSNFLQLYQIQGSIFIFKWGFLVRPIHQIFISCENWKKKLLYTGDNRIIYWWQQVISGGSYF